MKGKEKVNNNKAQGQENPKKDDVNNKQRRDVGTSFPQQSKPHIIYQPQQGKIYNMHPLQQSKWIEIHPLGNYMKQQLRKLNYNIYEVKGDGVCFFSLSGFFFF
jgi:hypothetical protein